MSNSPNNSNSSNMSRRNFVKTATAAGLASLFSGRERIYASGSDKIRIGLIGCGGRGTGAGIIDCSQADQNIELVAIGDLFQDHIDQAPERIRRNMERKNLPFKDIYKVTPETTFVGFNAYKKVINCDLDMIILTTPPVFRPIHFAAAVAAGKHVFTEKPVAVDPVGIRSFIKTSELAQQKKLTVVAGTQMRRARHLMAIMERIHNGDLGEIISGEGFRFGGAMLGWRKDESVRRPEWSDMEWQLRRWLFVTWTSGDFLVEQHVHNLDLLNWALQSHPVRCQGIGGRQARTAPAFPNVFDHASIEYEYPNGVRIAYMGSQIDGITYRNSWTLAGTTGRAYFDFGNATITGEKPFKYNGPTPNPAVQEYKDALDSIRHGKAINEGKRVSESTMTAIIGRMTCYTGRALKWSWAMKASKLDLTPKTWKFGSYPLAPVAIPGKTKLI